MRFSMASEESEMYSFKLSFPEIIKRHKEISCMRRRIRDWYKWPEIEFHGEHAQLCYDTNHDNFLEFGFYHGMTDREIDEDKRKLKELKEKFRNEAKKFNALFKDPSIRAKIEQYNRGIRNDS